MLADMVGAVRHHDLRALGRGPYFQPTECPFGEHPVQIGTPAAMNRLPLRAGALLAMPAAEILATDEQQIRMRFTMARVDMLCPSIFSLMIALSETWQASRCQVERGGRLIASTALAA